MVAQCRWPDQRMSPSRLGISAETPMQKSTAPHRAPEKALHNQRRRSLPVAPATPQYLCKVRRSASRKEIQNQSLTRTALNPRSAEVWRQTGREREFRASTGHVAVRRFAREARGYWRFECAQNPAENVGRGRTGGGRGTGVQRSLKLECPNFHMGRRLESNCFTEVQQKFHRTHLPLTPLSESHTTAGGRKSSGRRSQACLQRSFQTAYPIRQ